MVLARYLMRSLNADHKQSVWDPAFPSIESVFYLWPRILATAA